MRAEERGKRVEGYLLYCVFHSNAVDSPLSVVNLLRQQTLDNGQQTTGKRQKPEPLLGVDGQPVYLAVRNGLSAAISKIAHWDLSPDIPRVLAYEKVIEAFHRDRTVIPMRYGCLFRKESQILHLLEERCTQYEVLLKELEDLVEMGIRVLLQEPEDRRQKAESEGAEGEKLSHACCPPPSESGQAYLNLQRNRYAEKDRITLEQDIITEKIYRSLFGLFVRSKKESSLLAGSRLLSLYFLVPRSSVELFHQAFRRIDSSEATKLLLSGPWPPYNFI